MSFNAGIRDANQPIDSAGSASVYLAGLINTIGAVVGSPFADLLTGDAGANRIEGGAGNDDLDGGGGDDELLGGAGGVRRSGC